MPSAIEPGVTEIVDRDGRRVRRYVRKTQGPSKQKRREMLELGLAWCRVCSDWIEALGVRKGICRPHANEAARASYAADPLPVRMRKYARARGIQVLPLIARLNLLERFNGRCAYCGALATSWDHIFAVVRGGDTTPGNIVPACLSCNSSKRDSEVGEWMQKKGFTISDDLADVMYLAEVSLAR